MSDTLRDKPREATPPSAVAYVYNGGQASVNVCGIDFQRGVAVAVPAELVARLGALTEFTKSTKTTKEVK